MAGTGFSFAFSNPSSSSSASAPSFARRPLRPPPYPALPLHSAHLPHRAPPRLPLHSGLLHPVLYHYPSNRPQLLPLKHKQLPLFLLSTDLARVVETQRSLERQLELIQTHQQEVEKALQSMEEVAERMYREEGGMLPDDDATSTRDAICDEAEVIERELEQMTEQVRSIINSLNSNEGGEQEATDGMTLLDAAVQILNNQLDSLTWIDEKVVEFSPRIQKLELGQGSDTQG